MRYILKGIEPTALTHWRAANPGCGYQSMGSDVRLAVRQALVKEQGGICAYTGRSIAVDSCHIEHPMPQTHYHNGEDVSYANMLACVPAPNLREQLEYGAQKKGAWPDPDQANHFVSPLQVGCNTRFSYKLNGEVQPTKESDLAASETISKLALNNKILVNTRKSVINGTILGLSGKNPLDLQGVRNRLAKLKRAENNNGPFEEFAFVLADVLEQHIRRVQYIRAQKKAKQ